MSVVRAGGRGAGVRVWSSGGGSSGPGVVGGERRWRAAEFAKGTNRPAGCGVFAIGRETRFGELTCRYALQWSEYRGTVTAR